MLHIDYTLCYLARLKVITSPFNVFCGKTSENYFIDDQSFSQRNVKYHVYIDFFSFFLQRVIHLKGYGYKIDTVPTKSYSLNIK